MSGIVGILHLDGAPVQQSLLEKLTRSLSFRGPDAQGIRIEGNVGFGHALLKTTEEPEYETQPFSLDAKTWIVADARVDARSELIADLRARSQREIPESVPDCQLILHSYRAWGEDCVQHLLGDFAFAIWDGQRQRLFCARDHMGVKLFYYAQIGPLLVFSNTIDCIRLLPQVSNRLNDLAVADFLLFGTDMDHANTIFADIRKLPPAHVVTWECSEPKLRRYWTLPLEEPLFYRRANDYTEGFRDLLRRAVGDRIRTNRLAVFMSGGLDSTTLAASACSIMKKRHATFDLQAVTDIDDIKPEERDYAQSVASKLGISINFHKWDAHSIDPNWENVPFRTPLPRWNAWQALADMSYWPWVASHGRVFFWGEGPDAALMFEWRPYLGYLADRRRYARLVRDCVWTAFSHRRPPFGGRIYERLRRPLFHPEPSVSFPDWFNPDFDAGMHLRERWEDNQFGSLSAHPIHPQGYSLFQSPVWSGLSEGLGAERTRAHMEVRYPYIDLRLLRFMLRVPILPWCRSKYLIRRAMRDELPLKVLWRSKRGTSRTRTTQWIGSHGLAHFSPVDEIHPYVSPGRVPDQPVDNAWSCYGHMRVRALNHWLHYSLHVPHNPQREGYRDERISEPAAGIEESL